MKELQARYDGDDSRLAQDIHRAGLYFRVSIVGACNLTCPFCHNEGGPNRGAIPNDVFDAASRAAASVGFPRIQLTGGEPTLHPRLPDLVRRARLAFDEVGMTTNGVRLADRLKDIVEAGITRLHISVQRESLDSPTGEWRVPEWLSPTIGVAVHASVRVQINLPVAAEDAGLASTFLLRPDTFAYDWKVFALLPHGSTTSADDGVLPAMVREADSERARLGARGSVFIRGYLPPAGIRCRSCSEISRCKEQSRSLRLGVDGMLRPCLATREWDRPFRINEPESSIREAAILALDF
jgi:molybdenum cofactor biosynthesis enzyme MoaA